MLKAIFDRRSIRSYTDEPIDHETLTYLLRCAIHAPTAHYLQPWYFAAVTNKALLDEFNEDFHKAYPDHRPGSPKPMHPDYHVFFHAPAVIFAYVDGKSGNVFSRLDCALAVENIVLAATDLDLGSVVIGYSICMLMEHPELNEKYKKLFGVPEGYEPVLSVAVGRRKSALPNPRPRDESKFKIIE
ncbi:MAG: nitroreductase family protein [Christensenellales bacterium]|jgi:nitroreductase